MKKTFFLGFYFCFMQIINIQNVTGQNATQQAFYNSYTAETKGDYKTAIAEMQAATGDATVAYEVQMRLGWLSYLNKKYAESMGHYSEAVRLKPYSIDAKLGFVKPTAALEKWDLVQREYRAILKIDPQNTTANYWLGMGMYATKKYDEAADLFEKVVNLYPMDADANLMLGWSYFALGKANEARAMFNKVLLVSPKNTSATEGLKAVK